MVCGQTGCGKSTLLRIKDRTHASRQTKWRSVFLRCGPSNHKRPEQASRIGYVLQNPDNQIVTDKVWHELAFGLESLGYDTKVIRLEWRKWAISSAYKAGFMRDVSQLSGGQKQTLNLASVMAMQPDVLILDEPTARWIPLQLRISGNG